MNSFQLTCFLTAANSLCFATAAKQLHVTQPTVTHQIQSLEAELQVKLFRRSTRSVELTPEGRMFVTDAKSMLTIEGQAKQRFSRRTDGSVVRLSVGLSNYAMFGTLAETLNRLAAEFTGLHPDVQVVPHEQLFRLLENGSADVIFGIREGGTPHEKCKYRELSCSSLVGVCRADHPLAQKETITTDELQNESLIFCNPLALSAETARLQMRLAAEKDPAKIHFCTSAAATFVLASAGFGVAIIPALFVPHMDNIRTLLIRDAPTVSFGIFYRPNDVSDVLKRFMQLL